MSHSPDTPRGVHSGRRHRAGRLGALAVAVLTACAGMVAVSQPAQALTNLDGAWTVSHSGSGGVMINPDGTYTSTCVPMPAWQDSICPSPTGTLLKGADFAEFHGTDGRVVSYRLGGLVSQPDTMFISNLDYRGTTMKRGTEFICTNYDDNIVNFTRKSETLVYTDGFSHAFAFGSNQPLGPRSIANNVSLRETSPNYFEKGNCGIDNPPYTGPASVHVGDLDAAVVAPLASGDWIPRVKVTVLDENQNVVAGAWVEGTFTDNWSGQSTFCRTVADGTCTLSAGFYYPASTTNSTFDVRTLGGTSPAVFLDGAQYRPQDNADPDGDSTGSSIVVRPPTVAVLAPTVHIGDLDNASSRASKRSWTATVRATVLDGTQATVPGATVSGTFTNAKGTLSCTTAADGTCTISSAALKSSITRTTFTVTGVVKDGSDYRSQDNADPDADSTGSTIVITRS